MVAWFPSQSKRSGLLRPEEPQTSSTMDPSGKISPALMTRVIASDLLFILVVAFLFKGKFPLCRSRYMRVLVSSAVGNRFPIFALMTKARPKSVEPGHNDHLFTSRNNVETPSN